MQLKQAAMIFSAAEVDEALSSYALRKQGIDPDSVTADFTVAYRIVEGRIIASIHFSALRQREAGERT